jgi:hypothetical protein
MYTLLSDLIRQLMALDYIGKRGAAVGVPKAQRIEYAREILIKELLPHIGLAEGCETKKAYFVGYMVHRWAARLSYQQAIGNHPCAIVFSAHVLVLG